MFFSAQVLVVARESKDRDQLRKVLAASGTEAFCCATLLEAESFLSGQPVKAIFAEMNLPDGDFWDLLSEAGCFQ